MEIIPLILKKLNKLCKSMMQSEVYSMKAGVVCSWVIAKADMVVNFYVQAPWCNTPKEA